MRSRARGAERAEKALALAEDLEYADLDYVDFLVEMVRASDPDPEAWPREGEPLWPDDYRSEYISVVHAGAVIPSSRSVYRIRVRTDLAFKMLRDQRIAEGYLARSWEELYESEYPHKPRVFKGRGTFVNLSGSTRQLGGLTISQFPPGSRLTHVAPSAVWAGDTTPELDPARAEEWIPEIPTPCEAAEETLLGKHFFFLANTSADLGTAPSIELGGGARWWSPLCYPGMEQIQAAFTGRSQPPTEDERPVTAVLTVPQQEGVRWQEDFDRAERLIQRLRVALNVSYGATPWIVGHYSVQKAQAGRPKAISAILLTGRRYRHTYDRYQSPRILSDAQVESVGRIVTTPVKKKKLLYYVQRALDSLDFARTLPDDAARLLLTWTALETLLSPEDQRELSTNIALSLLGIDKVEDPPRTFRLVKRSYGVRSKVVHAFEVPAELDAAIDTANVQVERAIRYVIDTALSEGLSRDQLTVKLRNRVLCGIQARASRSPS